jgi:hypothetical protein
MDGGNKRLEDLQPNDVAWYKGKDGTIYEVRVGTVAKAGPHAMPVWVQIFWTDVEGTMIVMHPQRDLMTRDPRPPLEPSPVAGPVKQAHSHVAAATAEA